MAKQLDELEALTVYMGDRLHEATYEELEEFVDNREVLISQLQQEQQKDPSMKLDKRKLETILNYDKIIVARMNELKEEAAAALARVDQGKRQKSAYDNAYAADSYFFDQRK